jgi:hypothetical protein
LEEKITHKKEVCKNQSRTHAFVVGSACV